MAQTRRAKRIPVTTLERAAMLLRVLAHPHRLRIVEILLEGPVPVSDLADAVGLAPAAVSQHLTQMRAHDIVAPRREGRQVYYEVINPNAVNLIGCIRTHGAGH
jgi:DNA-binding transcriptional ArsR family regulator